MSFRLFARGTGDYHHTRNYSDEGDVYDLAEALGRVDALSGGVSGVIENEVANAVPNSDGGFQAALNAMGTMQCMSLLRTNFTLALANAGQMTVFVAARSPNLIFPDTSDCFTGYYTTRDYSPVRDFIRDVNPTLETADLNRFRVIGAIAEVLGAWNGSPAPRGERLLNITVTDT
ncbi:MAG: hypothetical protein GY952_15410 [Rhodobacteraceae bacterium]|nr:hypothetical protein [Paracoccaceae bacterium]